jgi:hypothetical protein
MSKHQTTLMVRVEPPLATEETHESALPFKGGHQLPQPTRVIEG